MNPGGSPRAAGWRRLALWFFAGLIFWPMVGGLAVWLAVGNVVPWKQDLRNQLVAAYSAWRAPRPDTADYAPIAHTGGNLFGANTFLYQEVEEAKMRRSLAMLKEAGFGYVREQVAWQEIERVHKGGFWDERWDRSTWAKLDQVVDLVEEYGLQMIARVDYPPDWALPPGQTWHATPPERFADYGDFVYQLADRYRGRVKYYQIWNEPNLAIEWGMRPVDPAEYTELLKVAYTRIKEADPEAVVIAAALAPTIERGPMNLSDLDYLRGMYEAGAKDYFDIASVNPYGLRSGPYDRRFDDDDTNFSRPIRARAIMVEYGDAEKPIWAAETGWCALPPAFPADPVYGRATREQQARYTRQAYERVREEWPWLGMMSLWHFRMVDNRMGTQQAYYFALVDDDFTPFPVFGEIAGLAGAEPALYPGFRAEDHSAIRYWGAWESLLRPEAALGALSVAGGAGDGFTFAFHGSALDLVFPQGPRAGSVAVSVYGGEWRTYGLAAETWHWDARVPAARGLGDGPHSVEVLVLSGRVAFDGAIVGVEQGRPTAAPLIGLLAALVVALVVAGRGRGG